MKNELVDAIGRQTEVCRLFYAIHNLPSADTRLWL